jgi:hypothetical protein
MPTAPHNKKIKRNALKNAIDVTFFIWVNNAYIFVWPCSLHAFDSTINHIKNACLESPVCDPAKIFLTSKFSYLLFFSNPTYKTKTRTTNKWETTR